MRRPLAALLAALALAACSGGDAQSLLAEGRYSAAEKRFEADLAGLKPGDAGWMAAKRGHIAALAHTDVERATRDALELLATHGAAMGESGVRDFALQLKQTRGYRTALALLQATLEPWPESAMLDATHSNVVADYAANDTSGEAQKALAGLGYASGAKPPFVPRRGVPPEPTPAR